MIHELITASVENETEKIRNNLLKIQCKCNPSNES